MAESKPPSTLTADTVLHYSSDGKNSNKDEHAHTQNSAATASVSPPPAAPGPSEAFTFHAIGYLSSCFKLKFATPRQGTITPSSRASLTLLPHIHPSALVGLSSYSHCWLLFVFHHNTNRTVPTLLHPPRLPHSTPKVGLFATRSPVRFNPIGLSLCRVAAVSVEQARVELSCVDLIEGTPILDIKPYHPCDQPPPHLTATYPAWLTDTPHAPLTVSTADSVREQLTTWAGRRQLERYNDAVDDLCSLIVEMVSFDPRPAFIRQKREGQQAVFGMRVDSVNVLYWVDDQARHATVCDVELVDAGGGGGEGGGEGEGGVVDERERTKRWLERVGRTDGRRSLKLLREQAEQKQTAQPSTNTTTTHLADNTQQRSSSARTGTYDDGDGDNG